MHTRLSKKSLKVLNAIDSCRFSVWFLMFDHLFITVVTQLKHRWLLKNIGQSETS